SLQASRMAVSPDCDELSTTRRSNGHSLPAVDQFLYLRSVCAHRGSRRIPGNESDKPARRSGEAVKSRSALQATKLHRSSGNLRGTARVSAFYNIARGSGLQTWLVPRPNERYFRRNRSFHVLRANV